MAAFLNVCRFSPTLGGTTDWTYSAATTGYQSPTAAGVVNGRVYKYRAESSDLSQWEIGEGAYNTSTGVLARTTVFFNSSGGTSKINFTQVPQVAIVTVKEDLIALDESNQSVMINGQIIAVPAGNALPITIQTVAALTPSISDAVSFIFKTQSGSSSVVKAVSSLTISIPSATTIGTISALQSPIFVYAINNAGTVELAVSLKYFGPFGNKTTVAVSGGATSTVMYSTTARTSVDYICIGVLYSTQTTAGTWVTSPSSIEIYPFQLKQYAFRSTLASNQTTSAATFTKVQLSTEVFDADTCYDSVTNFRFVCREPGKYLFSGAVASNSGAASGTYIRVNNSTVAATGSASSLGGAGASIVLDLIPNDYVELFFYTALADAVYGNSAYSFLSGAMIR